MLCSVLCAFEPTVVELQLRIFELFFSNQDKQRESQREQERGREGGER